MIHVAVAIPFGGECEYRERNVKHVSTWIEQHHGYPILYGTSDRDPFSPAQARNNAAAKCDDWDVMLFWDGDTLAHPTAIVEAVELAYKSNKLVFCANAHMYMDRLSTQRFLNTGLLFPSPTDWPDTRPQFKVGNAFDPKSIYRNPSGGILAVSQQLWRKTGGYCDSLGGQDSYEDLVFFAQCQIFGEGVTRVDGISLHLWHPPAQRVQGVNHKHYYQLVRMMKRDNSKQRAREYLQALGHHVP